MRAQQKISSTAGGFVGPLDNDDFFGSRAANIGDLDGDGVTDLAVGATQDDDGGTDRGAIYILFMNTNGTVRAQQKISSIAGGFTGPLDNSDRLGTGVASLGDMDDDGVADLAVGASQDDDGGIDRGAVYILFMNTNGTVKAERKLSAASGFTGPLDNGDLFGSDVRALGDLDGDGFADLAVSAVLDDDGGTDIGAIWMLELDGCDTPPMIVQDVSPACVLLPAAGGSTGFSITATGDGTLTYQWRKDGAALVNGGSISGATSPALTINATAMSAGVYDCVVTNAFGSATSAGAILGVRASCAGDADSSGAVGLSDIAIVVQNWTTVCE